MTQDTTPTARALQHTATGDCPACAPLYAAIDADGGGGGSPYERVENLHERALLDEYYVARHSQDEQRQDAAIAALRHRTTPTERALPYAPNAESIRPTTEAGRRLLKWAREGHLPWDVAAETIIQIEQEAATLDAERAARAPEGAGIVVARHAVVQASIHLANKDLPGAHEDIVVALDALQSLTRAARAEPGLREAAQAVMDVADYYTDTNDEPMWDALPVELTDKLSALRAALEAHGEPQEGKR